MTEERQPLHTGGCQCGALRYAVYAAPFNPHICHCRMCQKAFGGFFAPFASVKLGDLAWTRGAPAIFTSSPEVERGFCARCGTPLTCQTMGSGRIAISLGSLDDPAQIRPRQQLGAESRMPWFAELHALPETRTEEDIPPEQLARIVNRQHPDHDTEDWPLS